MVFGIPRRGKYNPRSHVFKYRKNLAGNLGAAFIDFTAAIDQYAQEKGLSIDLCYEDHPAHPLREISFGVGYSLGKKVEAGQLKNEPSDASDLSEKFHVYTSKDWPYFDKETRENRVMRENFSILRYGEAINFRNGRCLGYYINVKNTYCTVTLEDIVGNAVFRTSLYYPRSKVGLQKDVYTNPRRNAG